ncbi:hypothetical protein WOLCODRAFT_134900 [Wolfiporia cocos MD-104 SS10]|uniref:Brl1/Brr6 domain-containing protein n=1 Tax=Wolfiporia cocos (strain MD-104) TaxID=742152 RepID=A0A2H3ISY4_WOLCO|nr:hypothetical protein WOLCODRAFT_134900 [Wolfiporia cocos MD-104 SS10]
MSFKRFTVRSTETPMDFEFTSRPSSLSKPVWATNGEDTNTSRKRPLADANTPASALPASPSASNTPHFGSCSNTPFLFQQPAPQSPHTPAWAPPPHFSAAKAFPQPEPKDVDMLESSPPKPAQAPQAKEDQGEAGGERAVATGAMRRVFNARQRAKERGRVARGRSRAADQEESDDDDGGREDRGRISPVTQNTSNHYTLNMPGPAAPQSDIPYVLLGYLQFFFNLSLILVFLYLLIQFILTVQRDVEQRIAEYSMDIVQEIAQCALHYKTNLCVSNPIPATTHQCAAWETCMNRDPSKVGRAKVGAELIAEVVNGFVEPISWKTLAFTLTSLAFLTVFINALLSLYRARINPATHPAPALHTAAIPSFPIAPRAPYAQHYIPPPPDWGRSWVTAGTEDESAENASRRRRLESGAAEKIR